MRKRALICSLVALGAGVLVTVAAPVAAPLQWTWHYSGAGISASGTLTTNDVADSAGYFQIIGITGLRNGVKIVGMQPTGTAIAGNEPYAVDNLIGPAGQQLTDNGFGFALADGTFVNPFFAHNQTPSTYLEFFSSPYTAPGSAGPSHSELPVSFGAALAEPAGAAASGGGHAR